MRFLRKRTSPGTPEVSIILLDWSVRESFHTLEYLGRQRVERSRFEVVWIEFYGREAGGLKEMIRRNESAGVPPPVDTWIVMDNDTSECYHKHVMYNAGIINSSGRITVVLDSDAIVRPTFVGTVMKEFEKDPGPALHFEQIRNFDRRFYPFNYPSVDEITGDGCVNAKDGVPVGFNETATSLKDDPGLWHVYNYGACLCAKRDDLIRTGGADEHADYLGHICGPYEMTARLINAGVRDRLHLTHFLYHVWHPNQGGENDYCGPNNGKGMSTTAMEIPATGRVLPLKENSGIRELRLKREARNFLVSKGAERESAAARTFE